MMFTICAQMTRGAMGTVGTALLELRTAQKSAKGVSLYSRYVNRPVGRYLAAGSHAVGLSPNQVTLVSAVFSFAAVAAVALGEPSPWQGVAVWAGLAVGFAFDSADGQLARLRGGGSAAGSGWTTWWTARRSRRCTPPYSSPSTATPVTSG